MSKKILILLGSPNQKSRSTHLAKEVAKHLSKEYKIETISADLISAKALLSADFSDDGIKSLIASVISADAVITSTPVYKASFSAALKSLIDVLPENSLKGKTVLSLASGGSQAHLLAIDHALHPVIASLKAERFIPTVYAVDSEIPKTEDGGYRIESTDLKSRLKQAAAALEQSLNAGLNAASDTYSFRLALI